MSASLTVVENLLQDMVERQRLSRFDTVIFLLYPIILIGVGYLVQGILQFESLLDNVIFGIPFVIVLLFGTTLVIGLLGGGFLVFLRSYFGDDLACRVDACNGIVSGLGLFVLLVPFLILWPSFIELGESLQREVFSVLGAFFGFGVGMVSEAIWHGVTLRNREYLSRWFEKYTPRLHSAARPALESMIAKHRNRSYLGMKLGLFLCCLTCFILLFFWVKSNCFCGRAWYDAAILTSLIVATVYLILRKRFNVILGKKLAS